MIQFFQKNKLSILILTIFVSIYGIFSVINIPKEAMPSVNLGYYMVMLTYPGADPSTVEQQAVSKLEQKIKSITMVKQISSTSSYNVGMITVEFYKGKSDVDATNDLKSAIDQVYPSLPSDVKLPTMKKIDVNDTPVYTFSIAGPYSPEIIYQKTKILENIIKAIPGVRELTVIGKPVQEIQIQFDLTKLGELNLDVSMVIGQLKSAFIKLPADKKEVGGRLYSFEITNYAEDLTGLIDQISDYDILSQDGKSIKVRDVADIYLASRKAAKKSFVVTNLNTQSTTNGISFQVSKVPGFDIQALTLALKDAATNFVSANPEFKFVETESIEDSINRVYNLFVENFLETGLLVFLIIRFFLGARASFMILFSFLVVYLTDFVFLQSIGYSFNNIVSFSLILVLGIMIDNLIVIAQGIVVGLRKFQNNIRDAIKDSLRNYARPIIFGTSTTIAIFVPLYFGLSGAMGEFIKSMPVTIISNLAISLVITLISLPIIATYFYKPGGEFRTKRSLEYLEKLGHQFASFFYHNSRARIKSFGIAMLFIGFFVSSLVLVAKGVVKVDFMGNVDSDNVRINVKYNPGISIEDNQKYTYQISQDVLQYLSDKYSKEIKYVTVDLGSSRSTSNLFSAAGSSNNLASFTIRLTPTKGRNVKSYTIVEDLQNFFKPFKSRYSFLQDIAPLTQKSGPSSGKPVGFYIVGDDYVLISKYINQIRPLIEKIPGVFNIGTSIEYTNGRFTYTLDENKIKQYGLSNMSVAMTMMAIQNSSYQPNGIKIDEFTEFGDDPIAINALVKYTDNLDTLKIGKIYLNQIIKSKKLGPELLGISKLDGDKVVLVSADKKNEVALSEVTAQLDEIIKNNPMPAGLSYKPAADAQVQADTVSDMSTAMIIGIILMYLVLVLQFNNAKYATVIITSVFLTVGGSIYILALFGATFSFVAQLGIFGVLGVGVNQALIHLEDFKDYYEKQGYSVRESFRMSISERFVPIFLTKIVTIVGLIILATKDEMFGGLAMAFIGGLIVSFFVNLLYIPTLMRLISREYYNPNNINPKSGDLVSKLYSASVLNSDEDDVLPPEPTIVE